MMPRFRLVIAFSVSIALVGGATWFRFTRTAEQSPELAALNKLEQDYLLGEVYVNDLLSTGNSANSSTTPTSQTDLISRQLFSDYAGLTSQNKASSKNINSLAEKYAENIIGLQKSSQISKNDIFVVADSNDSLIFYSQAVTSIRAKYENLMANTYDQSGFANAADPKFKVFMLSVADFYNQAASELKSLATPTSLADNHIKLINNYLSSSNVAKSLGNIVDDPAGAYAALNTQAKNSSEEAALLSNINVALLSKGINPYAL